MLQLKRYFCSLFAIIFAVWHNVWQLRVASKQIHKVQGDRMRTMTDMQNKMGKKRRRKKTFINRFSLALRLHVVLRLLLLLLYLVRFFVIHKSVSKSCGNFDIFLLSLPLGMGARRMECVRFCDFSLHNTGEFMRKYVSCGLKRRLVK